MRGREKSDLLKTGHLWLYIKIGLKETWKERNHKKK